MSVNKEETLRQFCDVTGADEARSRFFLDSSNWQLEVALSSFYEHGGSADEASANPTAAPAPLTLSDSDMDSPPGSPLAAQKKDKKRPTTNSRFATLGSLQQQESSSDEEEERKRKLRLRKYFCDEASCSKHRRPHKKEDKHVSVKTEVEDNVESLKREIDRLKKENSELRSEIARLKNEREPGQAFYAGGSERSGQQILGPPGKSRKDIVTEMFKSVRERGAVVFEDEPSTASRGRGAFSGVGYRLGQTADDHEPVSTAGNQQSGGVAGAAGAGGGTGGARSVRLRLYREGFTVDDGALRHYSDPDNAEFLGCIRRGEIPPELSGGGGEVRVSLEDRRHEECPRPGAKTQVFAGKGQMLGRLSQIVKVENSQTPQSSTSHGDSQVPLPTDPTPPTVGATAPVAAAAADRTANQRAAQEAVGVDDSKPVTTIQIRLADGSRLTGRFNHSHTVGDLQQYVARAEPTYQLLAFTLLSSFPSAELADPAVTIKDANLLNSTVLQRLK